MYSYYFFIANICQLHQHDYLIKIKIHHKNIVNVLKFMTIPLSLHNYLVRIGCFFFDKIFFQDHAILFKVHIASSYPMKQQELATKARTITGAAPLYKALGPSVFIKCVKTSPTPLNCPSVGLGFQPDCNRLLRTSGGSATIQLQTPAKPPARRVRPTPRSLRSPPPNCTMRR